MTRHVLFPQSRRFYLTPPSACPYLANEIERKVFTTLEGSQADIVHETLMNQGFRRSQRIAYRPACPSCSACHSVRIPVDSFSETRRWRRVLRRNADLDRQIRPAEATLEQYDLLKRYLRTRHRDGGMAEMRESDYAAMVEETSLRTHVIEYRLAVGNGPGVLLGATLSDRLRDGLSMVYSFFDPEHADRSLGAYMILDHIRLCRDARLAHVYLGYWVKNSDKMDYKGQFHPLETLNAGVWTRGLSDREDQPSARNREVGDIAEPMELWDPDPRA